MLEAVYTAPVEPYRLGGLTPRHAARPATAEALAQAVALAHEAGLAVVPWGGGTHQQLGALPSRYDAAIATTGLDRVREHHPEDLIITVEAGMTLEALQAHLAAHGQYVPLEAEDPARATVGGLLATGVAGPLRFSCGTARDFTLWIEAVRPDGTLVHGGAKVVKNVAGYDTPKLFLGSLGTVGVITAACFKVLPLPETRWTTLLGFYHLEAAEEMLLELASARLAPSLVSVAKGRPAWGTPYDLAPWVVAVGADGPEATTDWQVERFLTMGREANAVSAIALDGEGSAEVRRALMARRAEGPLRLKLNLLPDQVAAVCGQLEAIADGVAVFAEVGNGVVRCAWPRADERWRDAAQLAEELGGGWVLEACPDEWRGGVDVWGPARSDRALMARLKAQLDPAGTLNPGRFVGAEGGR